MKADLAKLRALLDMLRALTDAGEDYSRADAEEYEEGCAEFITEHGDELLAIAEAVERAPVGVATAAAGSDGGTWLECDGLGQSHLDALNGQRVRLLEIGEDG